MTPTHGNDSTGDRPQEHGPTDPPTDPIPPPRIPRTAHLHTPRHAPRHPRPARPSTVWPCAQYDLRESTVLIAGWLLTAVIKIVTTYTQPGQRVLLLTPSPFVAPSPTRPSAAVRSRLRHGPYDGLLEAGWTVVRLGRGIQTRTIAARPDPLGEDPGGALAESKSEPGLPTASPPTDDHLGPSPDRRPGLDPTATGHGPDHFDLIITAAEPHTLDWLRPTNWTGPLTPTGTLAVITHGDHSDGRLADPAGPLVRAARHTGLRYLDRIALLQVPIRDGALAATRPAARDRYQTPTGPSTTSVRHTQAHNDLFLFTRQLTTSGADDGEETSDD